MITPTKGISPDRALLAVGAQIAMQLDRPLTVSQTWARLREWRRENGHPDPLSFGWFVLALDVLHALGIVDLNNELLTRETAHAAPAAR
ncbi:ABC-three component system middle component 6 [Streptomyces decoyicus]